MFIPPMFLIVGGGEPPGRNLLKSLAQQVKTVIAADKGAEYCLEAGITPHLVVGDMDSAPPGIPEKLQSMGVEIRRFSTCKDYTDTQIALDEAISRGAKDVEIAGATGDRFDHELANLHLLKRALDAGVRARITSRRQQVFLVDSEVAIIGRKGFTASFLPLSGRVEGITLTGFAYELKSAVMEIGNPYGVSNVIIQQEARVQVETGILVAVLTGAGTKPSAGE
jgi:thiamine pyrophosphokinase